MAAGKRVLSGIQTSGTLHIGNYIGALKRFIDLQNEYDCYFFLADLHAITVAQDPAKLRQQVTDAANMHLACGLDPERVVFFRQSSVPPHTELGWLLNTIATMGELRRMTQFKDKSGDDREESIGVGLFDYPVLQAADILLYQPDLVPVGQDQKQHVELTRDLATRFNHRFGETFKVPDPLIPEAGAKIMGLDDPTKKMSKSASSELNFIALTDSPDNIRKKIGKAVTDSGSEIEPGEDKPALTNLLTIFSSVSGKTPEAIAGKYAGKGYKELKDDVAEAVVAELTPIQARFKELRDDPAATEQILQQGAEKARPVAEETLARAKQAMGL